ncbi:arylsulfatase J-like [Pomacea canaliculata]|uniref:arylsulfatase J-like n=1 Tax=Pomacea canaliculata TaxID=400727 RepID=UPI000D72C4CD|nr:arylsulfatase J-like [Pomacea canaliculata]
MIRPSLIAAIFAGVLFLENVASESTPQYDNIIIMLMDDFGYADHQGADPEMRTPNINLLRQEGVTFNQSYVLQVCAPTRSAILTARYPYTYGMQINQIKGSNLAWLNESLTLMPQYLEPYDYVNSHVGKWHLGHCNKTLTPLERGFHFDYGFYTNALGFFNHSGEGPFSYDFRNQTDLYYEQGTYAADLFRQYVRNFIANRDKSKPFFIYYAMQSVHCPCEAKQELVNTVCSHIKDLERRTRCAMVYSADEAVGDLRDVLISEGIYNSTTVLLMSDNGGPLEGAGTNWPLRGQKSSLWEGGTRSFTVLRSAKLRNTNTTFKGMIHAVDWLPTLMRGAGLVPPSTSLDGQDLWNQIVNNSNTGRTDFVYNMDDTTNRYCVRKYEYKYCEGVPGRKYNGWYPPASMVPSLKKEIFSGNLTWGDINFGKDLQQMNISKVLLFNIEQDPQEIYNLADLYPAKVDEMKKFLRQKKKLLFPFVVAEKATTDAFVRYNATFGYEGPGWC